MKSSAVLLLFITAVLIGCNKPEESQLSSDIGAAVSSAEPAVADDRSRMRIVMEDEITPATNTLWAVDAVSSEEDWVAISDAAQVVLATIAEVRSGGTDQIFANPSQAEDWQQMTTVMEDAVLLAQQAAQVKDMDMLMAAGDAMYPPCENCHLKYSPSVIGDQSY